MILLWLGQALRFLLMLVIPPPGMPSVAPESTDRQCAACGNTKHSMKYVVASTNPGKLGNIRKGLLEFQCKACGAVTWIEPLYKRRPTAFGVRPIGPDEVGGAEFRALT